MRSFSLARAAVTLLALSTSTAADSAPFTLTISSTNATLSGTHAYISDPSDTYDAMLLFTSDPAIPATNFTLDNSGGHLLAHTSNAATPILEANIDTTSYDEMVWFSDPADGLNWIICHEYTNYISCSVYSESTTRLSKLYVCPKSDFGTLNDMALKIGHVVPSGCSAVQLNFTNVS